MPSLSNAAVVNAKPKPKAYKLSDGEGLYLYVSPSGGKLWRMKYRFDGKEKVLSFGPYPARSLAEARACRAEAKRLLVQGIDPGVAKQEDDEKTLAESRLFSTVAEEWFERRKTSVVELTAAHIRMRLDRHILPKIGSTPIKAITPKQVLDSLREIEAKGHTDTAHRVLQNCAQIFRYAVACGYLESDPTRDLRGALSVPVVTHQASLTDPKAVAGLLRAIWEYQGSGVTACALRLAAMTFVRPGELRRAEWNEIDLDAAEWRIPAEKMKMRQKHIVPLSRQAIAEISRLQPLTGKGAFLFPSERTAARPMSENTVNAALRRLGFSKEEMTGHGFRSIASTLLNEQGWNRDAIERQLAHAERNSVRASYNFAEFLPERRKMMQAWSDYLDSLRIGNTTSHKK